jgi:hypothetical protein
MGIKIMAVSAFNFNIASGATLSSGIDLGRGYEKVGLAIPTMTSATNVLLKVSDSIDGTYRALYDSISAKFDISSAISNCVIPVNLAAQFVKVELSTAMTATSANFKLICSY